jgi:hypothetical protein
MRFSAALLLLAFALPAHAATKIATDAFEVSDPGKEWKRSETLDPPGRLTWNTTDIKKTHGQIRISFEGAPGETPRRAAARILDLEKARVREGERTSKNGERGTFEPDSIEAGGLHWVGFRVSLRAGPNTGAITRWVAIHPDFPRRKRAFVIALDEETNAGVRPFSREPDMRKTLISLAPHGNGILGGIATAALDARAAAFAAHLDTTTKLCWRDRPEDSRRGWLGLGRGIALEGDFWQISDFAPTDSVVDAASTDYGASFDRNGDGKVDLVLMNRGIIPVRGGMVLPFAAVLADDNFDGRIDGVVVENGDTDGDGRADHRILVEDTDHDGRPDRALRYVDSMTEKAAKKLTIKDGIVTDRVVGSTATLIDFVPTWKSAEALMAEIDKSHASCK